MARSADRIVAGLRGAGRRVDVLHLSSREESPALRLMPQGAEWTWPVGSDAAEAFAELWAALRSATPRWRSVVAFGGPLPLHVVPILGRLLATPYILALRGSDIDVGIWDVRRSALLRVAVAGAQRTVVVSSDKRELVHALVPECDVTVVANGIAFDQFAPLPSDIATASRIRRDWDVGDRLVVGCFGYFKRKKGLQDLAAVMAASPHQDGFALVVVGEVCEAVDEALTVAAQRGLRVVRGGIVGHAALAGWMLAVDVVALPSRSDGMPNVMLEAGACGRPVLATHVGGMADVLEDGVHGWTCPPLHRDALAATVDRMWGDRERLQNMGQAWQEVVVKDFSVARETAAWLAALAPTRG